MRKINITTAALFAYLGIMGTIAWPGRNPSNGYTEYFLMLGATTVIIILLRLLLIKRLKAREEWKNSDKR